MTRASPSQATSTARHSRRARARSGSNWRCWLLSSRPSTHPSASLTRGTRRLDIVRQRQRGELQSQFGVLTPASGVGPHLVQPAMPVTRQEVLHGGILARGIAQLGQGMGRIDAGQAVQAGVKVEDGLRRTAGQPFCQPSSDLSLRRRQAGPQREIGLQHGLRPRLQLLHHLEQIGLGPAQPLHEGEPLGQAQVQAIDLLRHRIDLRLDSLDRPLRLPAAKQTASLRWRRPAR